MIYEGPLGRNEAPDRKHIEKYPLSALPAGVQPRGIPVVAGINWYTEFDRPEKQSDHTWWIAKDGPLTTIRGGHCVCLKAEQGDLLNWWRYYNQGREGACVGFGTSRMMSDLNRHEYDAFELYHATQAQGGYVGQEGAYVRDALEVLRVRGPIRKGETLARPEDGITAYRWASSLDEIFNVLDMPKALRLGAVPILNSWGDSYPHIVWLPGEKAQKVFFEEGGEVGIVTDR